nr:MerR family transcriptional regulator [Ectobacillus ponti]
MLNKYGPGGGVCIGNVYRIGELAELAHVSKRTIDYYTNLGLLTAQRSQSNYRYYDEQALQTLRLIEHCKRMHMPLCEIKSLLEQRAESQQAPMQVEELAQLLRRIEGDLLHIQPQLRLLTAEQQEKLKRQLAPSVSALMQALLWQH